MKAILFVALLGLSLAVAHASNEEALNDDLHFNIGHAIGDVGHFIEKNHAAIATGIKIGAMVASLGFYDNQADNQLFDLNSLINDGLKTFGDATKQNPDVGSLINDGINIFRDIAQNNQLFENQEDNELFDVRGAIHNVVQAGKNEVGYALQHPDQIVNDVKAGVQIYKTLSGLRNNGFFDLNSLINDGLKTVGDATKQNPDVASLIRDGINIFRDIAQKNQLFENQEDNELFDVRGAIHNAVQAGKNEVGYALQHPDQIVNDVKAGVQIYKTLSGLRNNGFFNLDAFINDGAKTFGDVTNQHIDIASLIKDGLKIYGDINYNKLYDTEEDNELFDLNSLINDGLKTFGDATKQNPDVGSLINDGINIFRDIAQKNQLFENQEDNELFDVRGAIHNAVQAGKNEVGYALQHPDQIVNDVKAGVEIYKTLSGLRNNGLFNLNGLINDGLKTVGDATKQNPDLGSLINDGINIFRDVTQQNELFEAKEKSFLGF